MVFDCRPNPTKYSIVARIAIFRLIQNLITKWLHILKQTHFPIPRKSNSKTFMYTQWSLVVCHCVYCLKKFGQNEGKCIWCL